MILALKSDLRKGEGADDGKKLLSPILRKGRCRGEVEEVKEDFGTIKLNTGEILLFYDSDLKNVAQELSNVSVGDKVMCRVIETHGAFRASNIWLIKSSGAAPTVSETSRKRSRSLPRERESRGTPRRRPERSPDRRRERDKRERGERHSRPPPRRPREPRRREPRRESRTSNEKPDQWLTNHTYTGSEHDRNWRNNERHAARSPSPPRRKFQASKVYSERRAPRNVERKNHRSLPGRSRNRSPPQRSRQNYRSPPRREREDYKSPPRRYDDSQYDSRKRLQRSPSPSRPLKRRSPPRRYDDPQYGSRKRPQPSPSRPLKRRYSEPAKVSLYNTQRKQESSRGSVLHYLERRKLKPTRDVDPRLAGDPVNPGKRRSGVVDEIDYEKNWGFIQQDGTKKLWFFVASQVKGGKSFHTLDRGDRVTFSLGKDSFKGKWEAHHIMSRAPNNQPSMESVGNKRRTGWP